MIDLTLVVCAIGGGLLASLLGFFDDPTESRSLNPYIYWVQLIIFNPLCGAFLVSMYLLDGDAMTHIMAMNVGISAPLVIRQGIKSGTGNKPLQGSDVET